MSMGWTSLELAALLLAVEFALLAWLGPILMLRRSRQEAASEETQASALLDDVVNKEPSRRDALATIFASTYQLEGDELDGKINEFVEREQAFYEVMTSVYLDRDGQRLHEIPDELTKLISPWIRMTPNNMVDKASLDDLANENDALNSELDETKRNMDELMAEYQGAFDKAAKLSAPKVPVDAGEAPADEGQGDDLDSAAQAGLAIDIGVDDDPPSDLADASNGGQTAATAGVEPSLSASPDAAGETPPAADPLPQENSAPADDDSEPGNDDLEALFSEEVESESEPA